MGKVPAWGMGISLYAVLGAVATMLAVIEGLYATGLIGRASPDLVRALVATILGFVAVGFFVQTRRLWKRESPRLCPNCGRYVPLRITVCNTCGHLFE